MKIKALKVIPICNVLLAATLASCAGSPPVGPSSSSTNSLPLAGNSGVVIGTLSYQFVEITESSGNPAWVVHLERVDTPATRRDYTLMVNTDPKVRTGVFTGVLPAGVYAFREAANANHRFVVSAIKMPFEVQAGAVQDVGHYALNPLAGR
ncbi:MAG: hypothetical protein L0Y32_04170 [Nevskiales bacterium]|nr:hypothetical protein [Nevskiales bacterium]